MKRSRLFTILGIVVVGGLLFLLFGRSDDGKSSSSKAKGAAIDPPRSKSQSKLTIDEAPRASIAGIVRDETGQPVAKARVCGTASSQRLASEDLHELRCAVTARNGSYVLPQLLPARYSVSASAPGFMPSSYEYRVDNKEESDFALAAGELRDHIDLVLEHGGVEVKGVVSDISGGSIAGAWVSLEGGGNSFRFGRRTQAASAVTISEDDGSFCAWVSEGSIYGRARAAGYADDSSSGMAPGQFLEIVLTPESVLAGQVVEATTGEPVADVMVSADAMGG